jgi:putative transposase
MAKSMAVTRLPRAVLELKRMNYQGEGWEAVRDAGRGAIRNLLEGTMERVRSRYLRAMATEGEDDRRNGYYRRHLLTSLGNIELSVARTRTFSASGVLTAYARREKDVDRLILACFVLGLSTRKVGEALLPILGERVSASTVSRVAKTLDDAVTAFHRRRFHKRYRTLIFDGVVLARKTGAGALKRPVLVALGMTRNGRKEILDFQLAPGESEQAWSAFLSDLQSRGLQADGVELIGTDGGKGLLAALAFIYPRIPTQRCWAHKTRNILDKIRKADREKAKKDLHRISHAPTKTKARGAARRFANRWEGTYPAAVACLRRDLDDLLQFFLFKDESWRQAVRTTNAIERRFREVKRRTRPMGVFSDKTSIERILYAVFSYENHKEGTSTPFLLTQRS